MIQFLRKTTKTIFYIFLGLSCVLFSFTLFLSSDQAKKLIISKSDSLLESTLDYSSLQLTWTPLPHLTIYNLQVENESLKFKSSLLSFDPDPRALFTEHFPVNALKITNPNLVIHRSLIPKNTRQPELNDQLTYPKTLLISLINSDLNLLITNGQVTLTSHNAPSYLLTDINLSQQSKHKEILRNFSALLPKFGLIKYTGHTQSANREFNSTIHFQSIPLSSIPSTATIQELERLKGKIDLKLNIHTTMAAVNKLLNQASLSEGQHLTPSQTSIIADGDLTISHLISPIETDRDENFHIIGDFSLKHNGNEFLAALTGHNISLDNVRNFAAPFQSISPTLDTISNIVRGGTVSTVTLSTRRKHFKNILKTNKWQIEGKVTNGRLHIPYPKMDLNQVNGTFSLEDNTLRVREATAFFQETSGTNCYLDMGFGLNSDIFHLSIDLNANLSTLPAILHQVLPHGEVRNTFHKLKSLRGTATGSLVVEHKDSHFNTKVDVSQFQLTGRHGELPYPFLLKGKELHVTNHDLQFKSVDGEMRFSNFSDFSGTLSWEKDFACDLHLPEGTFGTNLYALLPKHFHLNDQFDLAPPFTLHDFTFTKRINKETEVSGTITREEGEVSLDILHTPKEIDIRKLTFHDPISEARITFNHKADTQKADISFDGQLHGSTLALFLSGNTYITGHLKGYSQALIDLKAPLKSYISGKLEAEKIYIPLPGSQPLSVSHCLLSGSNNNLELNNTSIHWLGSNLTLNGRFFGRPGSVFMKMNANADRIDLNKTIANLQSILGSVDNSDETERPDFLGAMTIESDELLYGNYVWSSVKSILTIDNKTVTAKIDQAELCGIATLGQFSFSPHNMRLELTPYARPEINNYTIGCLTGRPSTEEMSGLLRVDGTMVTKGKNSEELLQNITGSLDLSVANGEIKNTGTVGTFTNLFSYLRFHQLISGELPDLNNEQFKYDSFIVKLIFQNGKLFISEAFVDGQLIDIVATEGEMDLKSNELNVNILICPLKPIDTLVKYTPILGHILQGTLIAIPLKISGNLLNPEVSALSPSAYGSRALNIVSRILQAPIKIIEPILE